MSLLPIPTDRVPLEPHGGNAAGKKGQREKTETEGEPRSAHVPCTRPTIRCGTSITITTHRELNRKRSGVAGRPSACRREKGRTSSRDGKGRDEKRGDVSRKRVMVGRIIPRRHVVHVYTYLPILYARYVYVL